jgi:hypothetical protein
VLRVRRTGGFIGRTVEGVLDLAATDDRVPEVRRLVTALDLSAAPAGRAWPDMYTYVFDLDGVTATVPEHLLTPDLRRLADLLLKEGLSR